MKKIAINVSELQRQNLVARLRSQAAHDGKAFPSGGEPPTEKIAALLREAADFISNSSLF